MRIAHGLAGVVAAGAACVAYAGLYEVNDYRLRRVELAVLPPGKPALRVLHISDLHLTSRNAARQAWVSRLAALEPDLVIDTGDNLAAHDGVPVVTASLGRLLDVPGVFVWGSNDYYAPVVKNPLRYLLPAGQDRLDHPADRLQAVDQGRHGIDEEAGFEAMLAKQVQLVGDTDTRRIEGAGEILFPRGATGIRAPGELGIEGKKDACRHAARIADQGKDRVINPIAVSAPGRLTSRASFGACRWSNPGGSA